MVRTRANGGRALPQPSSLELTGVKERLRKESFLGARREALKVAETEDKVSIPVSEKAPGEIGSVLCLKTEPAR